MAKAKPTGAKKKAQPAKAAKPKTAKAAPKRAKPTWLVNPPKAGQVRLHFDCGKGATISPKAKEALDRLARELVKDDALASTDPCPPLHCEPGVGVCKPEGSCRPALVY